MAKKVKLADVLWRAANEQLWPGPKFPHGKYEEYSCHAVEEALPYAASIDAADTFLASLGCDRSRCGTETWRDAFWGPDVQGVRYMWLLLAMHVAEDENITIEVAS